MFPSLSFDQLHLLDTGWCDSLGALLMRDHPWKRVRCPVTCALLHHRQHGWGLFDTGFAPRMLNATRKFPFRLYRAATPLHIQARLAVAAQLPRFGLHASDIEWIVLSHLHADHVAGALDFPNAQFILSRAAWEDAQRRSELSNLRRGVLRKLFPLDLEKRALWQEELSESRLNNWGRAFDVWNDGAALLVELPGHARGQLGLLANVNDHRVFFVADACYERDSIRTRRGPHPLTHFLVDDKNALQQTLERLSAFARACPDVEMMPVHCSQTLAQWVKR